MKTITTLLEKCSFLQLYGLYLVGPKMQSVAIFYKINFLLSTNEDPLAYQTVHLQGHWFSP